MRRHLRHVLRRFLLSLTIVTVGVGIMVCAGPVMPQTETGQSACNNARRTGGDESSHASTLDASAVGGEGGTRSSGRSEHPRFVQPGSAIEDSTGHALDAFHEALAVVERASEPGVLARVSAFGDSHTAADFMTGQLRRRLQERFGDGGHGFIAAGRPWPSYRHRNIRSGAKGRWDTFRVRQSRRDDSFDGRVGLAGVAVETSKINSMVWVATETEGPVGLNASRFELYYLSHPSGGRFGVTLDNEIVARLSSRSPEPLPSYFVIDADDGAHELRIETQGRGSVRLFGTVVEREGPGVVVDSLGINGARITAMLAWDDEVFTHNLAHRGPDLIVFWYGANSVGDNWYTLEQYEQWVREAVTRVQRAVPDASCLLVGPPDMARATLADRGPPGTPPALHGIITAQRDAASLCGCGFFDTYEAMGGEGSNLLWADQDPPMVAGDGIHFTMAGYRALADLLYDALADDYQRYLETN